MEVGWQAGQGQSPQHKQHVQNPTQHMILQDFCILKPFSVSLYLNEFGFAFAFFFVLFFNILFSIKAKRSYKQYSGFPLLQAHLREKKKERLSKFRFTVIQLLQSQLSSLPTSQEQHKNQQNIRMFCTRLLAARQ